MYNVGLKAEDENEIEQIWKDLNPNKEVDINKVDWEEVLKDLQEDEDEIKMETIIESIIIGQKIQALSRLDNSNFNFIDLIRELKGLGMIDEVIIMISVLDSKIDLDKKLDEYFKNGGK